MAAPASTLQPVRAENAEPRLAAYHLPAETLPRRSPRASIDGELRTRVAEARHVLKELQAFVDAAAATAALGDQLKHRRQENDRLRTSLSNSRVAKSAFENHVNPSEIVVAALTKTIVRNWLETEELDRRSDEADRRLAMVETSWLATERRAAALKRRLADRQREISDLRRRAAMLRAEIARTREDVAETLAETRRLEREEQRITAREKALRRDVGAKLRSFLLESRDL